MFDTTLGHELFSLIAPVQLKLHRVSYNNGTIPNAPKHYETHKNMSFGSNGGGIGAFVAKMYNMTSWHELFSLIAPVQFKLHRVSYSNKTIPNVPKHYETHQKITLLSNGLDQVRSLQKCLTRIRGTNIFI